MKSEYFAFLYTGIDVLVLTESVLCVGGKCFGPRGPTSYFFMLPKSMRVLGLRAALTAKFAQVGSLLFSVTNMEQNMFIAIG